MDKDVVFRSGAHEGKTVGYVLEHNPKYITWVKENRPEMLRAPVVKVIVEATVLKESSQKSSLQMNMNFWNEGPDEMSKPYLQKIQEEKDRNNLLG